MAASFRLVPVDAQEASNLFIYPFNPAVCKITIAPGSRWGLFRESDTITISTSDNSSIRVLAVNGAIVYLGPPTSLHLSRGHYFVECNGDRNQFCVLPDDYAGASFIGTGADDGTDSLLTQRLVSLNPSWGRTGDGQWATVEAQPGVFNWTAMDQAVAANAGRKLIAYAGDTLPSWVTSNNLVTAYTQFVQALVSRYPNQLYALEVWNEPWLDKFNTTNLDTFVALYLQLQSQARQVVKAINPAIQVIGPAWSSFEQGPSLAMTNSINLFDGFSWHDYSLAAYAPDQNYGSPDFVPSLQASDLSVYFGSFVTQTPLLVDELGLYGQSALGLTNTTTQLEYRSNLDWYQGMCRAIKSVVMYRADGVQAILPHVLALYTGIPTPNLEVYGWDQSATNTNVGRGPHPKTSAFLMTGYWLNTASFVDYRTPGQSVFLYAWQATNNTSLVFAWTLEGQTVPLINKALVATDIYGTSISTSSLTEKPMIFHSSIHSASGLLADVLGALPSSLFLPPVFSPTGSQSVQKGKLLQFTVSATDPNRFSLTYSSSPLPLGASFNSTTGAFSWTPTASQVGTYLLTFAANDGQAPTASLSVTINVVGDLFDGLADYWRFDENTGTTTADCAGQANGILSQFTFIPPSGWVPGENGSALSFDGVGSSVTLPSSALYFTNNFTVAASLYPRNAVAPGSFISVRSSYQSSGFRFFICNNSLVLQGQTTAGWQNAVFDAGAIQSNNWYQVVIVYDKSTVNAYVNDVYMGNAFWGGDIIMNTNALSRIGTEGAYYFNGIVDDVMLFNRTLGSGEIPSLSQGVFSSLTPAIASLKLSGANAVISFTTVSSAVTNELYEVDYRNDPKTGSWSVLTNGVPGTGGTLSITDVGAATQSRRFYRVVGHF